MSLLNWYWGVMVNEGTSSAITSKIVTIATGMILAAIFAGILWLIRLKWR